MKLKHSIYIVVLALLVSVGISSCKKDYFNINRNPNDVTDSTVTYNVLLPSALNNTGRWVANNWGWLQNWLGYWARSGTYAPNVTEETYDITTNFQTGIWTSIYDNQYDYQAMQISADKSGATFYSGIARIMKAHGYQVLVDIYGNVPYSQALKGSGNTTPAYDKGEDIYKDLFKQIDTGIALIKGATTGSTSPNKSIATDDVMFKGDKTLWAKFGNTLKLRLIIHLSRGGVLSPASVVPGFDIPAEIAKITAEGSGFLGAGQNAMVNPGYTADKPNPFYNLYWRDVTGAAPQNNIYYRANNYALHYYEYNGDPRENRFYEAPSGGHKGVDYGLPPITDNAAANLSAIGPGLYRTNTSSQWILTATESLFLQAEAIHRGYIAGGATAARTMTNNAITESFVFMGLTPADATAYLALNATWPDVDYNGTVKVAGHAGGGLFTIISQKYFALNGIAPYEVWTDYRRVNYSATRETFLYGAAVGYDPGPPISVAPQNTATRIPTRLMYPQVEYNYNPVNVGAQGTITKYGKVFWDN